MIYYNYRDFESDMRSLVPQCAEFDPQMIIAVSRGGLIGAQLLSYALEVRDIALIQSISYNNTKQLDKIILNANIDVSNIARVLVVDDIVDSGRTLEAIKEYLYKMDNKLEVKCASIWFKSSAVVQPDFKVREATQWVEFFWDRFYV